MLITMNFSNVVIATYIYESDSFLVQTLCWADKNRKCEDLAVSFW